MTELMRIATEGDQFVVVEVDDTEPGFELATREGAIIYAKQKFEDALKDVRGSAELALRVFADGTLNPDGVEVEFGVRLNAEAGAVIAKTSVEGHLAIKLIWRPEHRQVDTPGADKLTNGTA
jgi:Trypsin-co-occurring domain 1